MLLLLNLTVFYCYDSAWFCVQYTEFFLWFTLQGRGEVEEGAGKGIVDKSSTATTATAQREAIRKREKRKRALVRFLLPTSINLLLHTELWRLLLAAQCLKKSILSMQANEGGGKVPRPRAAPAKSPLASKSTGVRMMLSPRVISPSTTLARSSQESPMSPFINKRGQILRTALL
jgi:hypothetical protein